MFLGYIILTLMMIFIWINGLFVGMWWQEKIYKKEKKNNAKS